MKTIVDALNVRFGRMDEEGRAPLYWAKLAVVETEIQSRDGFYGVQAGEIRLLTDNENALAVRLLNECNSGNIQFPCKLEISLRTAMKKNEAVLTITDFRAVK